MGTIRLLLAISVVIAHSTPLLGQRLWGGEIAVELFFIISGFYMSLILNEKYNTSDKTMIFYKNRFLKLFPIYWATLLLTIVIFIISFLIFKKGGTVEYIYSNIENLGFFTLYILLSNLLLLGQDLLMFLGFDGDSIIFTKSFADTSIPFHKFILIPQSWTLSLEIMFYMLAPFIARKNIKVLLSLFALSVFIKISLWSTGYIDDPWSYRFILSELSFFFIGMIMYKIYKIGIYNKVIDNKILFIMGYILLLSSGYLYYEYKDILTIYSVDSFKYILYLFFILFLPLLFQQTKNNKIDRYIGELSYPVYIVHILVIMIINKIVPEDGLLSLFSIIGSVLFSILLNKLVQEKIEKIRIKNLKEVLNDK